VQQPGKAEQGADAAGLPAGRGAAAGAGGQRQAERDEGGGDGGGPAEDGTGVGDGLMAAEHDDQAGVRRLAERGGEGVVTERGVVGVVGRSVGDHRLLAEDAEQVARAQQHAGGEQAGGAAAEGDEGQAGGGEQERAADHDAAFADPVDQPSGG
jgi:hypothetical protein